MSLKGCVRQLLNKVIYGSNSDSDSCIKHLRSLGCRIGEGTVIFSPTKTLIDTTRPWLIEIGKNVQITEGVTILTHGYDWSVLKGVYGEVLGSSGGVSIGDNVFIGMKSTILKGTHIGNNVVIGANSLVNKNIPGNCVAAGNPCHVIMNLEEYYQKRKMAQFNEATELVREYRKVYNREPDESALREFFWLFSNNPENLPEVWHEVNRLCGNEFMSTEIMKNNKTMYNGMEAFLRSIQ